MPTGSADKYKSAPIWKDLLGGDSNNNNNEDSKIKENINKYFKVTSCRFDHESLCWVLTINSTLYKYYSNIKYVFDCAYDDGVVFNSWTGSNYSRQTYTYTDLNPKPECSISIKLIRNRDVVQYGLSPEFGGGYGMKADVYYASWESLTKKKNKGETLDQSEQDLFEACIKTLEGIFLDHFYGTVLVDVNGVICTMYHFGYGNFYL